MKKILKANHEAVQGGRTNNATRNIIAGLVNKIVHLGFPFIVRAIIIQALGSKYLGLSSLFTSILQVLNLAELGFSNAIIYSMYKPIAEKDKKTICALLNLYKRIYRVIGIVVLVVGLVLLPFLQSLIKGEAPSGINLHVLYLIYLFNAASTYFLFAYKSALINAHQRNDIISNVHTATLLLQFIAQIVVLLVFKNYYLYIIIQCVTSILNNILVAIISRKKYPEYYCFGEVSKQQKKDIKKRVAGLMLQKICGTTRNSFDSIFISAMFGLTAVAIYSNYYTVMTAIMGGMGIITSSIIASVGNSIVTESEKKNYDDMNKLNFIYMWISGWLTVCLACLYQPLMRLWMGADNMFPYSVVILFCLYFYVLKMGDIRWTYAEANGLWYEERKITILESAANIILNFTLGYFFGIHGIIAGTLISLFVFNFIFSSRVLYKHYFIHQKISEYFLRHGLYALLTAGVCATTYLVCLMVKTGGVIELILKGAICLILPNLLYFIVYHRTDSFKDAAKFVKRIFKLK